MATVQEVEQHVQILGVLSLVLGTLGALGGIFVVAFAGMVFGEAFAFILPFGFVLLVLASLGILGGLDLLARRARGRTLVLVYGGVSLLVLPFGTAYGVYAIWVLTRPESEIVLGARRAPPV